MVKIKQPEKTADIWLRYHWFPRQMTSEKRAQKFQNDDASLPSSSASNWLNQNSHAARPIRSTTQIWVVTRHQNGISALVSQMSFGRKPVVASPNVGCFLRLNVKVLSIKKLSFTKMYAFSQAFQAHVTSVLCKFTFSQESRCRVTSNR